eukprot:SAG11_NODE_2319_length_3526_cov_2.152028_2_plen_86_part_00
MSSVISCDQKLYDVWVNGNGYRFYPDPNGLVTSSRLEAIRDALEDMAVPPLVPPAGGGGGGGGVAAGALADRPRSEMRSADVQQS